MNQLALLGKTIREKRLSMNLRMEDVAKRANITRATLSAMEKGTGNCSALSIVKVLSVLGLSINIDNDLKKQTRSRATRINSAIDKKINRFVIMCVEQYASFSKKSSQFVYNKMLKCGVIDELTNDYEDLHGMSTVYLNDYIHHLLKGAKQ